MKTILIVLSLAFIGFGAHAQHDHSGHADHKQENNTPLFKDEKLGAVYPLYITVKNALVESRAAEAKKAASLLQTTLSAVSNGGKAAEEAAKVAATDNLSDQRKAFTALSNEMATLVKATSLLAGSVYVEYCPMANNSTGGYWLSNEQEIRNPYFGDSMLRCGSVKETIK